MNHLRARDADQPAVLPLKSLFRWLLLAALINPLCTPLLLAAPPPVNTLPIGAQVIAGQVLIGQSDKALQVTQKSDKAIVNWQSFNIGSQAGVRIEQPSVSAVLLNRVLAGEPSQIYGALSANGQVYLINPTGIIFGPGSQVDVGGLVASTLEMTDEDFLAGRQRFSRNVATGSITNQGALTAADGGLVALLAPHVSNQGVISARLGDVVLAAGDRLTLQAGVDGRLQVAVDPATLQTLIENRQIIVADGGQVLMSSRAADALAGGVVANSGTIQARTLAARDGRILLLADMAHGEVRHSGTLDASAPGGGNGGFIETSAAKVSLPDGHRTITLAAEGKTGLWLIDPNDYTIAASGGNITGTALSTALGSSNVTISTATQGTAGGNGDINVNDAVSWNSNSLTLTAERDVNINAVMTASGSAALAMNTGTGAAVNVGFAPGVANGFAGRVTFDRAGSGFLTINGMGYTVINSLGSEGSTTGIDLQGMSGGLSGRYALGADIDAGVTSGWNAGDGFKPVGNYFVGGPFTGRFDGLGHTITNLTIDRPTFEDTALFGRTDGSASISNVGLLGGRVIGGEATGALAGSARGSTTIHNAYAGTAITGTNKVGGLVGAALGSATTVSKSHAFGAVIGTESYTGGLLGKSDANIIDVYALGDVNGRDWLGGLVGYATGTLSNVFAQGHVTGTSFSAGGLVGALNGNLSNAYATGAVSTTGNDAGGLVGHLENGNATNVYATGQVTGTSEAGGLMGSITSSALSDAYATGAVSGTSNVGGLVGIFASGDISNAYAAGAVIGTSSAGGLIGQSVATASINNSFWDTESTGQSTSAGGVGKTRTEMKNAATFAAWSIGAVGGSSTIWRIYEDLTNPLLGSYLTPLTVTTNAISKVYDKSSVGALSNPSYSLPSAPTSGHLFGSADPYHAAVNVGTYAPALYSDQQGYDISYVNGALTISPAALSLAAVTDNKIYDGTTTSTGSVLETGLQGGDSVSSLSQSYASKDVLGTGGSVLAVDAGYVINDGNGGNNYTVSTQTSAGTITPAALTVTANDATSTYTKTAYTGGNGVVYSGFATGDSASSLTGTVSYSGSAQGAINAGGYIIAPSGLSAGNYTLSYVNGALTISPAALTVTANDDRKSFSGVPYGGGNGVVISGFVSDDDAADLSGTLAYGGTAQGAVDAGIYSITPSGLASGNYLITFGHGILRIVPETYPLPTIPRTPSAGEIWLAELPQMTGLGGRQYQARDPGTRQRRTGAFLSFAPEYIRIAE